MNENDVKICVFSITNGGDMIQEFKQYIAFQEQLDINLLSRKNKKYIKYINFSKIIDSIKNIKKIYGKEQRYLCNIYKIVFANKKFDNFIQEYYISKFLFFFFTMLKDDYGSCLVYDMLDIVMPYMKLSQLETIVKLIVASKNSNRFTWFDLYISCLAGLHSITPTHCMRALNSIFISNRINILVNDDFITKNKNLFDIPLLSVLCPYDDILKHKGWIDMEIVKNKIQHPEIYEDCCKKIENLIERAYTTVFLDQ